MFNSFYAKIVSKSAMFSSGGEECTIPGIKSWGTHDQDSWGAQQGHSLSFHVILNATKCTSQGLIKILLALLTFRYVISILAVAYL